MTREEMIADAQAAKNAGDYELEMHIYKLLEAMPQQELSAPKTALGDVGARALKNFPKSMQGVGQGVIDMVSHPIDTVQNALDLANAGMQKVLPESLNRLMPDETKDNPAKLSAVMDFYKNRYGGIEQLKETLAADPAGAFLDATTLLSLGAGAIKPFADKGRLASQIARIEKTKALNAPKARILAESLEKGMTLPPSAVNPGFWNKRLESIAGKVAIRQDSILRNQENFVNPLVRKDLGIPDDMPITGSALDDIRARSGQSYKEVAELPVPPSIAKGYSINSKPTSLSKVDLENLKQARNDAQLWRESYALKRNPKHLAKAKEFESIASELEARFRDRALQAGKPELVKQLRESRKAIAKTYTVDSARNVATGDIDPVTLGHILDKNPKLLTGELKNIAEAQQAFPQYFGDATRIPTPGVSKSEALASALMAGGGAATSGHVGLFAGGIPLIGEPIRNLILSKPYQKMMVKFPNKRPSSVAKIQAMLPKSADPGKAALATILYQMSQGEKNNATRR